jgi:hypothetical protein
MEFTTLLRRTEDPKLQWFESFLDNLGVPHQRAGHSFHAPILQVPEDDELYSSAWNALTKTLAQIADDETQDRVCIVLRDSLGERALLGLMENYPHTTTLDDIPDDDECFCDPMDHWGEECDYGLEV